MTTPGKIEVIDKRFLPPKPLTFYVHVHTLS